MTVTTTRRSYDAAHRRIRRDWAPLVEAGGIDCWRCERPIEPGAPWDLGHDDLDRSTLRGPEHRRCNRATKGRAPNAPASARTGSGGRLAERICEVCFGAYRPTYSEQRACGRVCGARLQQSSRPTPRRKPRFGGQLALFGISDVIHERPSLRDCTRCGRTFLSVRATYCSTACRSPRRSHYKCGHEATDANTYVSKRGRECRACRRVRKAAEKRRARARRKATAQYPGYPSARNRRPQ